MTGSCVLLTTLSVRTSAKGNAYLAGWLGKASVVAFPGEADKFGNPTWDPFLSQPAAHDGSSTPRQSPPARGDASGRLSAPSSPSGRPGGSCRAAPRPVHDGDCHG